MLIVCLLLFRNKLGDIFENHAYHLKKKKGNILICNDLKTADHFNL